MAYRVSNQSKQFFTLQTKLDYQQKMHNVIRQRCLSLHKQFTHDLFQLSEMYNSNGKLLQIQQLFDNYLNEAKSENVDEEFKKIKHLYGDILTETTQKNKQTNLKWIRIKHSLDDGMNELFSIHQQLKTLSTDTHKTQKINRRASAYWNTSKQPSKYYTPIRPQSATHKHQHQRQQTLPVTVLKQMNRRTLSISNIPARPRKFSHHNLNELKLTPIRMAIEVSSEDEYAHQQIGHGQKYKKKKKGVSFSMNTPLPNMPQLKETHSLQIRDQNDEKMPSLDRRHSDSMIRKIKRFQNENQSGLLLVDNEHKLNKDKIKNELLSERKMNDRFKRHSICSPHDFFQNIEKSKSERVHFNRYDKTVQNALMDDVKSEPVMTNGKESKLMFFTSQSRSRAISDGQEFSDDELINLRKSHFRNRTLSNIHNSKRRKKHKRNRTTSSSSMHYLSNPFVKSTMLSPNWAAEVALNNIHGGHGRKDSIRSMKSMHSDISDVMSTLSNCDYQQFILQESEDDEYEYENDNENNFNFVDIYGNNGEKKDEDAVPLHLRNRSYRFPTQRVRYESIIDPFDLLDDNMLNDLSKQNEVQLTKDEVKMREKLKNLLEEMDVMGEGKLDTADFTSGISMLCMDYADIMEDAEVLFEELESAQDDMGAIKIKDIVDAILLSTEDGAAKNIKEAIMVALNFDSKTEYEETETESDANIMQQQNDFENMPDLIVNPREIDPNSQPLKPMYQNGGGFQKI